MCGEYSLYVHRHEEERRFTPTCVGSTSPDPRRIIGDFGSPPHVWGVRVALVTAFSSPCGSPPHVWGVRGKSVAHFCHYAVHPHMCGEYCFRHGQRCHHRRFTPTCVGSTRAHNPCCGTISVHPHMCGEYSRRMSAGCGRSRFTPTCVGSTTITRSTSVAMAVHPHMCGEYYRRVERRFARVGSPPHVWGVRRDVAVHHHYQGGSPPHVWGVRRRGGSPRTTNTGSPPHVWGVLSVKR